MGGASSDSPPPPFLHVPKVYQIILILLLDVGFGEAVHVVFTKFEVFKFW